MFDRRRFLGAGLAGASALTLGSVWSQSTPNFGAPTLPAVGFRKMKLGDMELVALNDGAFRRPLGDEFVTNAPLEQVKAMLASQGLPTDYVDIPFTPFAVIAGNRKILLDTGFGDNGGPTTGKLAGNMQAAGLKPEDFDTIVISHFHGDHINGIRNKAGQLVYPNAKIMVPRPEYAFWMDDARMEAAPAPMKGAFQNVRRVFANLPADRLVQFEPGAEVAPGVTSIAAFGHTPGHTLFTVKSQGQGFAYVADIVNIPSLFARNPEWSVTFDMDKDMARLTRRKMFDMVVQEKMLTGGYHFPFPAFGSMQVAGNGYQFAAVA